MCKGVMHVFAAWSGTMMPSSWSTKSS